MRVILMLIRMHIRSEMEYRGAFLLDRLAQVLAYSAAFAGIWILLARFGTLGGWDRPELAFLLSFQLLAYSLGAAFSFVQFREFEELVRRGTLDALLVRPVSTWAYLTFSGFNIGYAGHVVLAVGVMAWSLGSVEISLSLGRILFLGAALVSASMLVAAVMMMIGASAIVLVQSRHLYSIFFGFWELTRYPIHIYPAALQWLLMTVMPLAFMNYVPVAVALGKTVPILGAAAGPAALCAGPVSAGLAAILWRFGLRRYQSGGG
jgi:ABC-2 type transport system permease protein